MRTLLLAPHNDDETLFASFLCLRYKPHVVICFRSMRMADPKYPGGMPVEYREREFETALAMKTLGCEWTQWQIPDTEKDPELVEPHLWALRDPSGQDDWDLVIAPASEADGQFQHNMIGELADMVFTDCEVIHYLTYTQFHGRTRSANEVEFEPDWVPLKLHALACYKTQAMHPETRPHFIDGGLREYLQ